MVVNSKTSQVARMEATADRTLRMEIVPLDLEEMESLSEKIGDLHDKFLILCEEVRTNTPPWRKTEFEQSSGIRRAPPKKDNSPAKS